MAPWGGVTCCLSAAALYLLGRSSGRFVEFNFVLDWFGLSKLANVVD